MSQYKWDISKNDKEKAHILADECQIEPLIALLLSSRGIEDPVDIDEFLSDECELADPYMLADMDKAVKRINEAIENFEYISVYGDYDADGITASVLLYTYLESKGAKVMNYIPDRLDEGYGMHVSSVQKLSEMGIKLIITVDNGICSNEEIAYASELGIDTVVTDHHLPNKILPDAIAVIDPHREDNNPYVFKDYAGVGVAFKLICAIEGEVDEDFILKYADLIAIGTIADIVPLLSENRLFTKMGLKVINSKKRVGINALLEVAGCSEKTINSGILSFGLAPRINASGRMGTCKEAFSLLLTENINEAHEHAEIIDQYNTLRKSIEQKITSEAINIIEQSESIAYDPVIVVACEGWHQGVLGIVAARLVKHYGRPAVVFSLNGDKAKGSARSFNGFNIYETVNSCSDKLLTFGGHKLALGLSLKTEDIDGFRKDINEYARNIGGIPLPVKKIDCCLNPLGITLDTAYLIKELEPFGQSNDVPVFGLLGMKIEALHSLSEGKHISINLSKNDYVVRTVLFGTGLQYFPYLIGDIIDVAVTLDINNFKNKSYLSVVINDMRPSNVNVNMESYYKQIQVYNNFCTGIRISDEDYEILTPTRDEVGTVFRYLRNMNGYEGSFNSFLIRLEFKIDYAKLRVAVDVLSELDFISCKSDNNYIEIKVQNIGKKQSLECSETYNNLINKLNRKGVK